MARHSAEYLKARAEMIEINKLVFACTIVPGSDIYFRIREICARYEREAERETGKKVVY